MNFWLTRLSLHPREQVAKQGRNTVRSSFTSNQEIYLTTNYSIFKRSLEPRFVMPLRFGVAVHMKLFTEIFQRYYKKTLFFSSRYLIFELNTNNWTSLMQLSPRPYPKITAEKLFKKIHRGCNDVMTSVRRPPFQLTLENKSLWRRRFGSLIS